MLGFGLEFGMADGFGGEVSFRFLGGRVERRDEEAERADARGTLWIGVGMGQP